MLWATRRDRAPAGSSSKYPYFEQRRAVPVRGARSPTPTATPLAEPVSYEWNHGLGEIVQAVLDAGLTLTRLVEHDEVDWPAYPWMVETGHGHWRLPDGATRPSRSSTRSKATPTERAAQ